MDQDLATLKVISDTLRDEPQASQRILAKKANISLGMMNAILGRFAERGWIMLTNVNGRKLAYVITSKGISELAERGKQFALRTFKIANEYNEVIFNEIFMAKNNGKTKVILNGKSYMKFLLIYVCKTLNIDFLEKEISANFNIESDSYNLVGELEDELTQRKLCSKGCISILDILNR